MKRGGQTFTAIGKNHRSLAQARGPWGLPAGPSDAAPEQAPPEDVSDAEVARLLQDTQACLQSSALTLGLPLYPDFAVAACGALVGSLCSLLRNDSMIDMSKRCELYHSVFELLKEMAQKRELCALLQHGTPSVASLLEKVAQQAELYVRCAIAIISKTPESENAGDGETASAESMAMSIRDAVECVRIGILQHGTAPAEAPRDADYVELLGNLRLEMTTFHDGSGRHGYNHAFAENMQKAPSSLEMMKRMKELSTMATNLPVTWDSGIFLRVDEERNDALKALIIGPAGTPYENGCFTFDIYLPPTYPDVPPQVQLVDTSGGNIRMNPNLYANGKVCLSLLGTWSGPGWIPGKSTLLQVLLSIQALILVSEPYYNEPGWETGSKQKSDEYNEYIRLFTVKVGMLQQLQRRSGVFQEVVETHFRLKKDIILAQARQWLQHSTAGVDASGFGFPRGPFGMGATPVGEAHPEDVLEATERILEQL
eukprot:TRINITY_DN1937_c2_g1_i3.p1 TRINITY_DN1937_c2_g1~~TRINITY_DN1937_c2_g1_i3.p1  ORF type:complete len:483 (+),score=200.33 TRINITY_DN1937_c2_g1_i3:684-2132(+)